MRIVLAVAVLGVVPLLGCGSDTGSSDCGDIGIPPLTVYLSDGQTGAPVCDATVAADAPGYHAMLDPQTLADCPYILRNGDGDVLYTVTVDAPGFAHFTSPPIYVSKNECGQPVHRDYKVALPR